MTDTTPAPDLPQRDRVDDLVARMTLEEAASLTAGRDVWHLPPIERLGIGAFKMSDGPSGVRGEHWGTRRSLSFPCGMAVGATWDVELVGRFGDALAAEARSKGVHLLLGPTVCIVRTPLAGRTFESFAEDPHLSSRLTVAYVRAVQRRGVGCCVKHFACNDQEHERMTISAEVDPVTLREVHLAPFEAAVREAGVWAVMSAYNRLGGTWCSEHPELLDLILKDEWGFDGVVVSDWLGTHTTVESTLAGLDVEMPGPPSFLGSLLADAVHTGQVDTAVVDEHAGRILRLAERCGLLDEGAAGAGEPIDEAEEDDPARRAVAREVAVGGTVLLRNDGVLPLQPTSLRRVAVVGPNARWLETGGGGSSSVTPLRDVSFVDELAGRLADAGVEVAHEEGCRLELGVPRIDPHLLGEGLRLEHFANPDLAGEPAGRDLLRRGRYVAIGGPVAGVPVTDLSLRATATFVPDQGGTWQLGIESTGGSRVLLDGEVVVDNTEPVRSPASFFGYGSEVVARPVELVAGRPYELVVELLASGRRIGGFELRAARPPRPGGLERAVAAAADADVAVVVVGANSQLETEGSDRPHLRLFGEQDELVRRVAAANPRTVVVLNGGPVEMPWIDDVAAALCVWYPGEEGAAALADVLLGVTDPGGRLPVTFPRRLEDGAAHAAPDRYPGSDGRVVYGEGLLVGYRHFDAHHVEPLFPFGHGLSTTSFEWGDVTVDGAGTDLAVRVPVTNTGERRGVEVVQLYVGAPDRAASSDRPVRQLAGFAKVAVEPGQTVTAEIVVNERAFARWDDEASRWAVDPGAYELTVGASSRDLRHTTTVSLP